VIINFGLNLLLIPKIGIWGAAITTIISSLYITIMFYAIAQKKFYIPYQIGKLFFIIFIPMMLYFLSFGIAQNFAMRIVLKAGIFAILLVIFYYLKFIEKHSIQFLNNYFKKLLRISC
jgi:O-antigen/teichoic acid export membrane protein